MTDCSALRASYTRTTHNIEASHSSSDWAVGLSEPAGRLLGLTIYQDQLRDVQAGQHPAIFLLSLPPPAFKHQQQTP